MNVTFALLVGQDERADTLAMRHLPVVAFGLAIAVQRRPVTHNYNGLRQATASPCSKRCSKAGNKLVG